MIIRKLLYVMLYLDHIWGNWQGNITQFVDADKIVFDGVTVDWCVKCKFNKTLTLDSIRTLDIFKRKTSLQCEVTLITKLTKYKNYWRIIIELK